MNIDAFDVFASPEDKTFVILNGADATFSVLKARPLGSQEGIYFHTTDAQSNTVGFPLHVNSPIGKTGIKWFIHDNAMFIRLPYHSLPTGWKWIKLRPTESAHLSTISYFIGKFNGWSYLAHYCDEKGAEIAGD